MDVRRGLLAAREIQVAAARRAGADEDRVIVLGQQRLQAVDPLAEPHLRAEVGDVADFLVDDFLRQAEFRDLAADHAAGARVADRRRPVVAQRREVAGNRQRGGAGADQGDLLAVACVRPVCGRRPLMSPL